MVNGLPHIVLNSVIACFSHKTITSTERDAIVIINDFGCLTSYLTNQDARAHWGSKVNI